MFRRVVVITAAAVFTYCLTVASLVSLALATPGAISPACTTPGAAMKRATATVPIFIPGDGFRRPAPTPSPTPIPQPVNPVEKHCDNDKVRVLVSNPQQFGHRIGEVVEINVRIWVDPTVNIDFQSLRSGVLKFDGTTAFHLAAESPVQIYTTQEDGLTLYTVMLRVQTFVPRQTVPFSIDLRYATGQTDDDAGSPDWKILTTPDYVITTSKTLDNGSQMQPGNMQVAEIPTPPLVLPLNVIALVCLAAVSSFYLEEAFTRLRRIPTRNSYSWSWETLERHIGESNPEGFDKDDMRRIAEWVRNILRISSCTRVEIGQLYANDPRLPSINAAIEMFDQFLYDPAAPARLEPAEQERLVSLLQEIMRKPK